ncbi:MAG TPA: DUF3786 domain-containing protein [Desulfobacteria bacterium]|nr:DUF3786 domain-containing protein [Desulfobacteria bacterium]
MSYIDHGAGAYKRAFSQGRQKLQALKPEEIVSRSLCKYDDLKSCFVLTSFGHDIEISYPDGLFRLLGIDGLLPLNWALILLNYLSSAKPIPIANDWVSYRDLPQGNVFFPNIRTHVLQELGQFYSDCDKSILAEALHSLGFALVQSNADLDAEGNFTPRVPVRIRFWEGEDEIPASCQVLFDRTASEQMHIEDIAVICSVVKSSILTRYELMIKGI